MVQSLTSGGLVGAVEPVWVLGVEPGVVEGLVLVAHDAPVALGVPLEALLDELGLEGRLGGAEENLVALLDLADVHAPTTRQLRDC